MADVKISGLPASTVPLAGTEVLPIVQGGATKQVSIANVTAGRAVSAASLALTTTPLPVTSGGTGLATLTATHIPYGNGTSAFASSANLVFDGANLAVGGNFGVGTATYTASGINIGKQYGGVNLTGGGGSWANWGGAYGLFPYSGVGLGISTAANIGFVGSTGAQIASINGTTGVYTPLSDKNQKKDFEPSTTGLDAVMQLKPTLYRMTNDDELAPKQLWFIAQDVESVIPQAFIKNVISGKNTPEEISFIGLDERPIIAALTLAIQQLSAKFDAYVASHP